MSPRHTGIRKQPEICENEVTRTDNTSNEAYVVLFLSTKFKIFGEMLVLRSTAIDNNYSIFLTFSKMLRERNILGLIPNCAFESCFMALYVEQADLFLLKNHISIHYIL